MPVEHAHLAAGKESELSISPADFIKRAIGEVFDRPRRFEMHNVAPCPLAIAYDGFSTDNRDIFTITDSLAIAPACDGGQEPWNIVVSGAQTPRGPPPASWPFAISDPASFHRTIWLSDQKLALASDEGHGIWYLADTAMRKAIFWLADPSELPEWEYTAPFRHVFHWAAISGNAVVAHAAAFGYREAMAVVTGPGGTGKSTLTAGAAHVGYDIKSEDLVWIDLSPDGPRASRIYDSIKLTEQPARFPITTLERLHEQRPTSKQVWRLPPCAADPGEVTALFCLSGRFGDKPVIRPTAKARIFMQLAPTTLFLMRTAPDETARRLRTMVDQLPTFEVDPGRDAAETAVAIMDITENCR